MLQELAIGATINSLRYCFVNDVPLVYSKACYPHYFSGDLEEFHKLYFCLSLSGNILNGDTVQAIRVTDDGLRIISLHDTSTVHADRFLVFGTDGVDGLPEPTARSDAKYEVLDWIDVRSGMKHNHERIENTSDFIKCIHFYPSSRLERATKLKDICVISHHQDGL